jgi:hypothetical protein
MAFGIMQTFSRRLERYEYVKAMPALQSVMRQFQNNNNRYEQIETEFARRTAAHD